MWTGRSISGVAVAVVVLVAGVANAEFLPGPGIEDTNEPNYVEGELLVRFARKPDATIPTRLERRAVLNALGGAQETGAYWLVPGLTVVNLAEGVTVRQALARFNARGEILYAEPNWRGKLLFELDDPTPGRLSRTTSSGIVQATASGASVQMP